MDNISINSIKPKLSFWQIWNMSFGFLGIQFGFALQNANVSRIFETLGAEKDNLPILWLAAPVTGLLIQPIIGYYSDRTWSPRWGRRRPFFAVGAILASIALFIMPNSPELWVAAGMLWLMDGSINISMEPFRAFVGDMLPGDQRTAGFAMQSFFIGIGAVIASCLPYIFTNWIGMSNTAAPGEIPDSVKWSFYLGGIAFLSAVMWTVFNTKEYPPEDLELLKKENKEKGIFGGLTESFLGIFKMPKTMRQLAIVQFFSWFALFAMWIYTTPAVTSYVYDLKLTKSEIYALGEIYEKSSNGKALEDVNQSIEKNIDHYKEYFESGALQTTVDISFVNYFLNLNISETEITPQLMQRLSEVQKEYNEGADWVGVCFGIYNGVAALAAFLLPVLARWTNRRFTHLLALFCGGAGLISIFFITDPNTLVFSMIGVGIAWASILSIPYAMLSTALPAEKMGYYMGVFNFFIVIPQIVAAGILGFILRTFFQNDAIYALIVGGAAMILAGLLSLLVNDKDEVQVS